MKRIIISAILSFFSFTSYTQIIDEIIAVVGDEVVLASDIETQYLQYLSQGHTDSEEIRCQIIEDVLYQKLLVHQAKLDSTDVSEDDVNQEVDRRLSYFISKLKNKETIEISGDGNYPINLVFVQDVVKCLLTLVEDVSEKHKAYNVCSDESITMNEIIDLLKSELNIETHYTIDDVAGVVIESSAFQELAMIPNSDQEPDNLEIKKDYGTSFIDVKNGIREYINEY